MADADLTLVVVDASRPLTSEDHALIARQGRHLVVANKCDLTSGSTGGALKAPAGVSVSALTGQGTLIRGCPIGLLRRDKLPVRIGDLLADIGQLLARLCGELAAAVGSAGAAAGPPPGPGLEAGAVPAGP